VTVTRNDIAAGHQLAETIHSVSEFAFKFPDRFQHWKTTSNYVVALSIDDEEKLEDLYSRLKWHGADVIGFNEPDINNQLTSICYYGTPELQKHTSKLKLALKNKDHEKTV